MSQRTTATGQPNKNHTPAEGNIHTPPYTAFSQPTSRVCFETYENIVSPCTPCPPAYFAARPRPTHFNFLDRRLPRPWLRPSTHTVQLDALAACSLPAVSPNMGPVTPTARPDSVREGTEESQLDTSASNSLEALQRYHKEGSFSPRKWDETIPAPPPPPARQVIGHLIPQGGSSSRKHAYEEPESREPSKSLKLEPLPSRSPTYPPPQAAINSFAEVIRSTNPSIIRYPHPNIAPSERDVNNLINEIYEIRHSSSSSPAASRPNSPQPTQPRQDMQQYPYPSHNGQVPRAPIAPVSNINTSNQPGAISPPPMTSSPRNNNMERQPRQQTILDGFHRQLNPQPPPNAYANPPMPVPQGDPRFWRSPGQPAPPPAPPAVMSTQTPNYQSPQFNQNRLAPSSAKLVPNTALALGYKPAMAKPPSRYGGTASRTNQAITSTGHPHNQINSQNVRASSDAQKLVDIHDSVYYSYSSTRVEPQELPSADEPETQVLEYLSKKGYIRTEAKLREETATQDASGRPVQKQMKGPDRFDKAFDLFLKWVDDALDVYKPELKRLAWPIFVYSYLSLAMEYFPRQAQEFYEKYKDQFSREHSEDLRAMNSIRAPTHVKDNAVASLYMKHKYRLTLTTAAFETVIVFLESIEQDGGGSIISLMDQYMNLKPVNRAALGPEHGLSLAAMLAKGGEADDLPAEDEGIPGHAPGSANIEKDMERIPRLLLGKPQMDQDLMDDVRARLQEEDERQLPQPGQTTLLAEFEQSIKQEPNEDTPSRDNVPMPPSLARDVAMEVQKVKENRDRFRIEGKTGGVGPGVSVIMYTFHNTYDSINCIDFSGDYNLVAVGTDQSYVRVWTMDGSALPNLSTDAPDTKPSSSRRLVGHSAPVYTVAFSPGSKNPDRDGPPTHSRLLLTCSADRTIRLWSLDLWQCLVVYKGHDKPVWDVSWGPHGHYFISGSNDSTARLWSQDHIHPLRIFQGHEQDVDVVAWHPNSAYTFTGSSDRTIRMWDINRGSAVRLFSGHTGNVTALACSPDGKTLASADDHGVIMLWDLHSGRRTKVMRGHMRQGIWSLSWSVESTVLISGSADNTVRVWDVYAKADAPNGKVAEVGASVKIDGGAVGGGKKGKKGEVVVSSEQISAFPTKKSPVYKVRFTQMNLCLAGGAYLP